MWDGPIVFMHIVQTQACVITAVKSGLEADFAASCVIEMRSRNPPVWLSLAQDFVVSFQFCCDPPHLILWD